MTAPTQPEEVCEVILTLVNDGGTFGSATWALVGQVMTPTGISVAAKCEYHSNNAVAEYQGGDRGFNDGRERITNLLLEQGWEPLLSVGSGAGIILPRFQRRVGAERERLLKGGSAGILLRRRLQPKAGSYGQLKLDVLVDGVKVAKVAPTAVVRLDLAPGNHTVQFSHLRPFRDLYVVKVDPGAYTDVLCGWAPVGRFTIGFTLRGADGSLLWPSDRGKPFVE
jgi:hypothetical protein